MYEKNKAIIKIILKEYKADTITEAQAMQAIQNVIGEEMERQDKNSDIYSVDEKEETPK